MKLVIPFTMPRQNDGTELRYAIRSMVKHFKTLSDIIICGYPPKWYTGKYVPFDDVAKNKEYSIARKVSGSGIDGDFLMSYDDVFALEDFDETMPDYYIGLCGEHQTVDANYNRMYQACDNRWMDFDGHTPMIINGLLLKRLLSDKINQPFKTFYRQGGSHKAELIKDLKIREHLPAASIRKLIKRRPFFSTGNNAIGPGMMQVLNELYPVASPYER